MCSSKVSVPFIAFFIFAISFAPNVQASMSSIDYRIDWDTVSSGGSDSSSSASYGLRDTVGNPAIGPSDSASYQLSAGYRGGVEDQLLSFQVNAEQIGTRTDTSDLSGLTATVTSSVGFSVGAYAAVIQDVGASQVSAFGKITSTTATTIVFDSLTDGGTSPVIDGSSDSVYLLEGATTSFGTLSTAELRTSLVSWEITAATENGYSVQLFDDGNLRTGSNDIDDVADAAVTAGAEEYGARSSDTTIATSTFDSQDTAITTTPQAIGTSPTTALADRGFVTLKVSVDDAATADGTYGQTLTFIATGNY